MAIIISQNGKNAVKVNKTSFEKEDSLQRYIYDNPDSIPLYEIKEDIKLLILAREFPTNSGPIDAIGIDKEGSIYIIETKLYKNPDKRTVVAQALDYGAALWKHANDFNEFTTILDRGVQKTFSLSLNQKLQEYFDLSDDGLTSLLETIKTNLDDGVLRFVVLMDSLDARLKDLILYVNQNSQFDIYAVELEYYKHDTYEIIIPRIFGAEVKKDIGVKSSSQKNQWTEELLLKEADKHLNQVERDALQTIYQFSKKHADEIRFGTGAYASFSAIFSQLSNKSIFTVSIDDKFRLSINFEWVAKDNLQTAITLYNQLQSVGFQFPENYQEIRPSIFGEDWVPKVKDLTRVLKEMLAK